MVASVPIEVNSGNITLVISRVPVGISGIADPDDFVDIVHTRDTVVDDVPELLEGGWAMSAPPEPFTSGS